MNRMFDIGLAVLCMLMLIVPILLVTLLVRLTSRGPVIFWSQRIGRHGLLFSMPKFRTMRINTPLVATHLLQNPAACLTPVGGFLRRSSLDELPQLWSILRGNMGFVGPRPALFNQDDLMALRRAAGVDAMRPGLTGWAQVNGRDELSLEAKVALERDYMKRRTLGFDVRIMWLTLLRAVDRRGISH